MNGRRAPAWLAAFAVAPAPVGAGVVRVGLDQPTHAFRPAQALGAGLDGHDHGDIRRIYSAANLRAMGSVGLGAISYRLRTELGVEAWHPTPRGRWSDPAHHRGYWTPTAAGARGRQPIVSFGYRLPRRGDTIDQANDDGYSRLDDGSERTFWKSNPYLDHRYTHEPDARHPQWVLVDLGRRRPVDAIRIDWGRPWATRLRVQAWTGPSAIMLAGHPPGTWRDLSGPRRGRPGDQLVRVAPRPVAVRFVRVLLERSSHRGPAGTRDVRDRLGFAIRELHLGVLRHGRLHDLLRHGARNARQTVTMASSTDPWHRAVDRDPHTEQPSFARVTSSGLVHRPGLLVPVPVLYGTPAAAVGELRYLRARHVPIRAVELGEEPDGQLAAPEDYGALYLEFARAIHRAFPRLRLGGPGFQTSIPDWLAWPDAHGDRSWTRRFLAELRRRRALHELGFFSFEWYPWDNVCGDSVRQLARSPQLLAAVLARQRAEGLPVGVPTVITEYGFSAFAGRAEVDRVGALFDADTVGRFLSLGGATGYLYGLEPDTLIRESPTCDTWGNLVLLQSDWAHRIQHPTAAYWAMRLVTRAWSQPGDGRHVMLATSAPDPRVRAYGVRRPDGTMATMVLNEDPARTLSVRVQATRAGATVPIDSPAAGWQLSAATYAWHPARDHGQPSPDRPPARFGVSPVGGELPLTLPPMSLTVVRTARAMTALRAPTLLRAAARSLVARHDPAPGGAGWAWRSVIQAPHYDADRDVGAAGVAMGLLAAYQTTHDRADLAAARRAGDWLLRIGQRSSGGGLRWPDFRDPHAVSDTHFTSFDDGAPGIADVLWRLSAATGDRRYRRAALAGLRWLRRTARGAQGQPCPTRCRWPYYDHAGRDVRTGIGEGNAGIAYAFDVFAQRTHDRRLERYALGAAAYLEHLIEPDGAMPERAGAHGEDLGFLSGAAGDAFVFLRLYRHTRDRRWLGDARRLLAWVDRHAQRRRGGLAWPVEIDPTGQEDDDSLATGIEEGAAGIGWVQLQAWALTGDRRALRMARGAGRWLQAVARHEHGGLAWPEDAGGGAVHTSLDNGAPGIGWFLDDLARATRDRAAAHAAAGAQRWLSAVAHRDARGVWWFEHRNRRRWGLAREPSWHWGTAGILAFLARRAGWRQDMPGEEPALVPLHPRPGVA